MGSVIEAMGWFTDWGHWLLWIPVIPWIVLVAASDEAAKKRKQPPENVHNQKNSNQKTDNYKSPGEKRV